MSVLSFPHLKSLKSTMYAPLYFLHRPPSMASLTKSPSPNQLLENRLSHPTATLKESARILYATQPLPKKDASAPFLSATSIPLAHIPQDKSGNFPLTCLITSFPTSHKPWPRNVLLSPSLVMTTPLRMAPAFATTSTSLTWQTRTS